MGKQKALGRGSWQDVPKGSHPTWVSSSLGSLLTNASLLLFPCLGISMFSFCSTQSPVARLQSSSGTQGSREGLCSHQLLLLPSFSVSSVVKVNGLETRLLLVSPSAL